MCVFLKGNEVVENCLEYVRVKLGVYGGRETMLTRDSLSIDIISEDSFFRLSVSIGDISTGHKHVSGMKI